jgi:ubiquinone/menaquinone biosynthesis C-methylase UbiE
MSTMRNILMRMFGRPRGFLGRLGGIIMARTNEECGSWVTELLAIGPSESVLEAGFGPGVIIRLLSNLAGHVAGIDPSQEMVQQARTRNAEAIGSSRVERRHGSVESLPFDSNSFDKVIAINSMQVRRDTGAGLREIRRVMRPGGRIALGFTPYSGQRSEGLTETHMATGFIDAHILEKDEDFRALAIRP